MAKVLLVDDSPLLVKIGRTLLEKEGHEVLTALDGREAVAQAKKGRPHIIFMDAEMPDMDGPEACRALKADASTKSIPVFICTGHDLSAEQTKKFHSAGAAGWIQKPYKSEDISALITKHT